MEKPFTIRANDLEEEIINLLNEAKMPCYVLKTILTSVIKKVEDADGIEITKYFNNLKNDDKESEK